jgi:hypothetical protein
VAVDGLYCEGKIPPIKLRKRGIMQAVRSVGGTASYVTSGLVYGISVYFEINWLQIQGYTLEQSPFRTWVGS